MNSYLAVLDQQNPGCDYTIKCGVKVLYTQAWCMESAFDNFSAELGWDDYAEHPEEYTENPLRGEQEVMSFLIFETKECDGQKYYGKFMGKLDDAAAAAKEEFEVARDRTELARLRKKLGE